MALSEVVLDICSRASFSIPSIKDSIDTSDATPITIPRTERNVWNKFDRILANAKAKELKIFLNIMLSNNAKT